MVYIVNFDFIPLDGVISMLIKKNKEGENALYGIVKKKNRNV